MRVFCYFVEPASYSLDLANNVYDNLNINYCFIKSNTLAKSKVKTKKMFLDNKTFFKRVRFIFNVVNDNDLIIVNGYNNMVFIFSFIFNIFLFKRKYIAIESDTKYSHVINPLKRFIKWLLDYYNNNSFWIDIKIIFATIFRNTY